ncbi:MAG: cytochrome c, partial [Hydrococcus sp. Prado102]|nr:cytochrome c [Hydrococcus sp. Prado102]
MSEQEQDQPTLIQTVLKRIWVFVVGSILVVMLILVWPFLWNNGPVRYADINEHFKYGSIGG